MQTCKTEFSNKREISVSHKTNFRFLRRGCDEKKSQIDQIKAFWRGWKRWLYNGHASHSFLNKNKYI